MGFVKRYGDIKKGGIIFIGNTLGLSKMENLNKAGVIGSIGAFTSLDTSLKVNDFPYGTTLNYQKNGSMNVLSLPTLSSVLYAELIWGGLYKSTQTDLSGIINNNITFGTPLGEKTVTPDAATKQNIEINLSTSKIYAYVRSANVTDYVNKAKTGNYYVKGVPALIEAIDSYTNSTNHAGWTLAVIYSDENINYKSLNLWVGGVEVSPYSGITDVNISGFFTPTTAAPNGKLFVSAGEGDCSISGDSLNFGKDALSLNKLSGVNNPINNFFCSQINDPNGYLNTNGTFGTRNANSITGTNSSAVRQGWDITTVDITGKLQSAQSSALIRFSSNGDMYIPNCLALQIDNSGYPNLDIVKSANKAFANVGDILTYTIKLTNSGSYKILSQTFKDSIQRGSEFVAGSVTVNSTSYPSYNPETGFSIPSLNVGQSVLITFKVKVIAIS